MLRVGNIAHAPCPREAQCRRFPQSGRAARI